MPKSVDTDQFVLPSGVAIRNGLTLAASDSTNGPSRWVEWVRTADGAAVAVISGSVLGANPRGEVLFDAFEPTFLPYQVGQNPATPGRAGLFFQANPAASGAESRVYARAQKSGALATPVQSLITDSAKNSDFAQQVGHAKIAFHVGIQVVSMPAVAAGGLAEVVVTDNSFNGNTPVAVLATLTTGGTIYFSNQYVIGTRNPGVNSFVLSVWSDNAFAAGWTIGVQYLAMFTTF